MSKEKLIEMIKKDESETLEFKPSLSQTNEIIETISAFANKKGGMILAGITNSGKILGVEVGKDTIERLTNKIMQNTEPKVYPNIKTKRIKNKNLIVVEIEEASDKPVLAFGRAFKRVGKSTLKMSRDEFKKLFLELKERGHDSEICEDASFEDIDKEAVNKFRERYEEINKTTIKSSNKELLKSLGCIKEVNRKIKVTNAGILLFGKESKKFFPMCYVTIARYPRTERAQTYSDIKDFYGNLFDLVESTNSYIKEHVQEISRVVKGKLARDVIPQYPYFAIRELITNAVVHRDYSNKGSRIIIRMFRDRIEFSSPGGLPANITPKNIVYEQYSRNPIIAEAFNKVKFIEKLGKGWDKIISVVKEHPLKPKLPKIRDTENTVIVTLYSPKEMALEKAGIDKTVNEWLTEVDAKLTQELSDKEKEIILFMLKNKKINSSGCQKLLQISREMANRYFKRLIEKAEKALIVKKGSGKSTYYELK